MISHSLRMRLNDLDDATYRKILGLLNKPDKSELKIFLKSLGFTDEEIEEIIIYLKSSYRKMLDALKVSEPIQSEAENKEKDSTQKDD